MDPIPRELIGCYLNLPLFGMVVGRLAGMIMFQPIFGALSIPYIGRALFVFALSIIVMPFVEYTADTPFTLAGLSIAIGRELLLGALIGIIGALAFLGLQMGGLLVAQESGLAFGQIADPTSDDQTSVLSVLYLQIGTLLFLTVGGHRALVGASLDSFHSLPLLASPDLTGVGVEVLITALSTGFAVALKIAAPTVITLFLLNIAMGFVSRTVPQLNIMTLGFTLKAMVGFIIIAVSLPSATVAFIETLDDAVAAVRLLIDP